MMGTPLKGCTAYVQCTPCAPCGRALIQAGITEVVISKENPFSDRSDWRDDIDFSLEMLKEAGVSIKWVLWLATCSEVASILLHDCSQQDPGGTPPTPALALLSHRGCFFPWHKLHSRYQRIPRYTYPLISHCTHEPGTNIARIITVEKTRNIAEDT